MISKESFVKIVNALDEYWNDKAEILKKLDIHECYFHTFTDTIIDALEADIDPKHTVRNDDLVYDCGAYIIKWLFGEGEFQETCPTAESLYDYIQNKYKE